MGDGRRSLLLIEAFLWGAAASSSLLVGGLLALNLRLSHTVTGLVLAFGAGVLISAVAYDRKSMGGRQAGGVALAIVLGIVLVLVSAAAAALGYGLLGDASQDVIAFVLAFAAGAILTMLADTMMPEAFEQGGRAVGCSPRSASAVAFGISALESP